MALHSFPFSWKKKPSDTALKKIAAGLFVFFILFTTGALVFQHLSFLTNAYDTGIQAGTARNSALHFSFYDAVQKMNYLGDHFSPALFLPGLLFRLWDNVLTAFLFQSLCIVLSVFLGYRLALSILGDRWKALLLTIMFAANYYLTYLDIFEYHIEVLAAPVFLLILNLLEEKRSAINVIFIILLGFSCLLIKEDMPIALGAFGFWLLLFRKGRRIEGLVLFLLGLSGFLVIVKVLMPYFAHGASTHMSRYGSLGKSADEIIKTVLTNPLKVLFVLTHPVEKIGYLALLLLSFMALPLFAPLEFLTALTPIFFHMMSDFPPQYMYCFQYSAAILPFLFYASAVGLKKLEKIFSNGKPAFRFLDFFYSGFFVLMTAVVVVMALVRFGQFYGTFNPAIYSDFVRNVRPVISKENSVYAVSELQPHFLYCRFDGNLGGPNDPVTNADYVVLTRKMPNWKIGAPWTWDPQTYKNYVQEMEEKYPAAYRSEHFLVLVMPRK